ncbi:MAG: hypothetical protein HY720_12815 [Planctomycetes bacterium]|nr:hypothetical protein [Planctomycetota bacterium]
MIRIVTLPDARRVVVNRSGEVLGEVKKPPPELDPPRSPAGPPPARKAESRKALPRKGRGKNPREPT